MPRGGEHQREICFAHSLKLVGRNIPPKGGKMLLRNARSLGKDLLPALPARGLCREHGEKIDPIGRLVFPEARIQEVRYVSRRGSLACVETQVVAHEN